MERGCRLWRYDIIIGDFNSSHLKKKPLFQRKKIAKEDALIPGDKGIEYPGKCIALGVERGPPGLVSHQ
jgi:hypothetical protein